VLKEQREQRERQDQRGQQVLRVLRGRLGLMAQTVCQEPMAQTVLTVLTAKPPRSASERSPRVQRGHQQLSPTLGQRQRRFLISPYLVAIRGRLALKEQRGRLAQRVQQGRKVQQGLMEQTAWTERTERTVKPQPWRSARSQRARLVLQPPSPILGQRLPPSLISRYPVGTRVLQGRRVLRDQQGHKAFKAFKGQQGRTVQTAKTVQQDQRDQQDQQGLTVLTGQTGP